MLTTQLLHPQILEALAGAGHGATVLIAAGNFPATTKPGKNATHVSLALAPGIVTCTQVLTAVVSVSVFEYAAVIRPPAESGPDPPAWSEYRDAFEKAGLSLELEPLEGERFMDEAAGPDLALTVATGDARRYTSLLLTVGVVTPR